MKNSVFAPTQTLRAVLSIVLLALFAVGCAPAATATPIPIVDLGTTTAGNSGSVKASAEVVPSLQTKLSFPIAGPLKEVTVKEGDMVEAGQVLANLDTPDLEYAVVQAQDAAYSAEATSKFWAKRTDHAPEQREEELDKFKAAKLAVETAKAQLAQGTMYAPFAGTVTSVEVMPGEYVSPGQVVIVLAKLDDLQIETIDLGELNIAAVKIGQPASVSVEALNETYSGKVTAISPIYNTIGGDTVFKVTIKLDQQQKSLLWGMSADVEINTQ